MDNINKSDFGWHIEPFPYSCIERFFLALFYCFQRNKLITIRKMPWGERKVIFRFKIYRVLFPLISFHRCYFKDIHYWLENGFGNWSSLRKWNIIFWINCWILLITSLAIYLMFFFFIYSIRSGMFCGLDGILSLFVST